MQGFFQFDCARLLYSQCFEFSSLLRRDIWYRHQRTREMSLNEATEHVLYGKRRKIIPSILKHRRNLTDRFALSRRYLLAEQVKPHVPGGAMV
jgi:hypothetical protein